MIIKQSKVSSISNFLPANSAGKEVVVAVCNPASNGAKFAAAGFSVPVVVGEQLLPSAVGLASTFNAQGRIVVRKDLEMETAYRQIVWRWNEWRGRHDSVEREEVRSLPYKRYPRENIPPPSVEFTIATDTSGSTFLVSPPVVNNAANQDAIKHIVNVLLDLFGECEILRKDLSSFIAAKTVRVPWKILPQGARPWPQVKAAIQPILDSQSATTTATIKYRVETVNKYKPDFVATGQGGFAGYLVLAFQEKDLYVLESVFPDNATYVFKSSWQQFSAMTKAQILNRGLQHARLIHTKKWPEEIRKLLT